MYQYIVAIPTDRQGLEESYPVATWTDPSASLGITKKEDAVSGEE